MQMYAICPVTAGVPGVDLVASPVYGYCFAAGPYKGYGLYQFSGSGAQLLSLANQANCYPLVAMSGPADNVPKWAELDQPMIAAARTKMNTLLTAAGLTNIPAGWTYRQVLVALAAMLKRAGDDWDINSVFVTDGT